MAQEKSNSRMPLAGQSWAKRSSIVIGFLLRCSLRKQDLGRGRGNGPGGGGGEGGGRGRVRVRVSVRVGGRGVVRVRVAYQFRFCDKS